MELIAQKTLQKILNRRYFFLILIIDLVFFISLSRYIQRIQQILRFLDSGALLNLPQSLCVVFVSYSLIFSHSPPQSEILKVCLDEVKKGGKTEVVKKGGKREVEKAKPSSDFYLGGFFHLFSPHPNTLTLAQVCGSTPRPFS